MNLYIEILQAVSQCSSKAGMIYIIRRYRDEESKQSNLYHVRHPIWFNIVGPAIGCT